MSLAGLLFAWLAWSAWQAGSTGNAMIFAGGAIAMCLLPLRDFPTRLFKRPLTEVVDHAVRNPASPLFKCLMAASWLLVLGGIASFFLV